MRDEVRVVLLRAILHKAAAQFRFYEKQHIAKGTPESFAKADVNALLAKECEDVLETTL